jgi:hypothetical protein
MTEVRYQFDDVVSQAHAAYKAGAKITDNPYPVGHHMRVMWENCFKLCESEHGFWSNNSVSVAEPVPDKPPRRRRQAPRGA